MKREEQKILREIKKEFPKMLKSRTKERKINMAKGQIYRKYEEYFLEMGHSIYKSKEVFKILVHISIKPYEFDNIFWEMFEIEDNKSKPDSFRAYGVYVAPTLSVNRYEIVMKNESEMEEKCNEILNLFDIEENKVINKINGYRNYLNFVKENFEYNNNELHFIIGEIESGNYKEAIRLMRVEVDSGKPARFAADQKSIYEFGIEYCTKKLNELI